MNTCLVCLNPKPEDRQHTDAECVQAVMDSGQFVQFVRTAQVKPKRIPPQHIWTDEEIDFAKALALQGVQWKRAELEHGS